jgi:hypothetical protein
MFHTVRLNVENMSQRSQEFPFSDFRIIEQYGAIYPGNNLIGDYALTDRSQMRIPGNEYEILLAFDVPEEANGLRLVSNNGSIIVDLASFDLAATPVPRSVSILGDGTVVEYGDWQITFDSKNSRRGDSGTVYHEVFVWVVNSGEEPQTFPFREFVVPGSDGSNFYADTITTRTDSFGENAEDELLNPNKRYRMRIHFTVDDQLEEIEIKSIDGLIVIRMDH